MDLRKRGAGRSRGRGTVREKYYMREVSILFNLIIIIFYVKVDLLTVMFFPPLGDSDPIK